MKTTQIICPGCKYKYNITDLGWAALKCTKCKGYFDKSKWLNSKQINFEQELTQLLNKYSKENDSNTPDFILSEYLQGCLNTYNKTLKARDKWFNIDEQKTIL